jgi:hypothetical protein
MNFCSQFLVSPLSQSLNNNLISLCWLASKRSQTKTLCWSTIPLVSIEIQEIGVGHDRSKPSRIQIQTVPFLEPDPKPSSQNWKAGPAATTGGRETCSTSFTRIDKGREAWSSSFMGGLCLGCEEQGRTEWRLWKGATWMCFFNFLWDGVKVFFIKRFSTTSFELKYIEMNLDHYFFLPQMWVIFFTAWKPDPIIW